MHVTAKLYTYTKLKSNTCAHLIFHVLEVICENSQAHLRVSMRMHFSLPVQNCMIIVYFCGNFCHCEE